MYKNPNDTNAKQRIIGVWIVQSSHDDRFSHLRDCWKDYCKKNLLEEDDDEESYIEQFMDEFLEDPSNEDFEFQEFQMYKLKS